MIKPTLRTRLNQLVLDINSYGLVGNRAANELEYSRLKGMRDAAEGLGVEVTYNVTETDGMYYVDGLHIGTMDKRILFETRVNPDKTWYFDAFVNLGTPAATPDNPHPALDILEGVLDCLKSGARGLADIRGYERVTVLVKNIEEAIASDMLDAEANMTSEYEHEYYYGW